MTHLELSKARRQLGLNKAEMAQQLRTPYRTYVDWERGARRIPGVCQVAVELLIKHDRWVMQAIEAKISKGFPRGSQLGEEEK